MTRFRVLREFQEQVRVLALRRQEQAQEFQRQVRVLAFRRQEQEFQRQV